MSSKTKSRGALLEQDDIVDAYEYDNESESLEHLNNTKVIDTPNNSKVIEAPTSTDLMMVESKEDSSTLALSNEPPECLVRSSSTNWLVCTYSGKIKNSHRFFLLHLECFNLMCKISHYSDT